MKTRILLSLCCVVLCCQGTAMADWEQLKTVPRAVTRPYGNISAQFLPDGRLVVWDGDKIYIQTMAKADELRPVAQGYTGDTAFMAVAPDGHTLLLGAGMSGKLYRFDVKKPQDYSPTALLGTFSHYWGIFLTQDLVLIDKQADDYSTDQLAIIDISQPGLAPKIVMDKPIASELSTGDFAASAALAANPARTIVYVMEEVFDASFMLKYSPLKQIPVADLIVAYQGGTRLDWNAMTAIMGSATPYATGGPAAVTNTGQLLLNGFGGVQRVNPATGGVIQTYSPGGFVYHGVVYDASTGTVCVLATDATDYTMDLFYAPGDTFESLPVVRPVGMLVLMMVLAVWGLCTIQRGWRV